MSTFCILAFFGGPRGLRFYRQTSLWRQSATLSQVRRMTTTTASSDAAMDICSSPNVPVDARPPTASFCAAANSEGHGAVEAGRRSGAATRLDYDGVQVLRADTVELARGVQMSIEKIDSVSGDTGAIRCVAEQLQSQRVAMARRRVRWGGSQAAMEHLRRWEIADGRAESVNHRWAVEELVGVRRPAVRRGREGCVRGRKERRWNWVVYGLRGQARSMARALRGADLERALFRS